MRSWIGSCAAALALLCCAVVAQAQSPSKAHIEKLRNVPAGKWLDLGKPAPDPEYGRARGRAWTALMPFAESLGGAFLFGEGVHGYADPKTGRYMDGLWLYDVARHQWKALWPGTDTHNEPRLIVNKDGFPALHDGNPVPIAAMTHAYQAVSWDSRREHFLFMPVHHNYYRKVLPRYAGFMAENRKSLNVVRASPWMFDIKAGMWRRYAVSGRGPGSSHGDALYYLPRFDKVLLFRGRTLWAYDPVENIWRRGSPAGPKPPFGTDATGCYDQKRQRIYFGGGLYPTAKGPNAFWIYDVADVRFVDPKPAGTPGGNLFSTNVAMMQCNQAQDTVLVIRHKGAERGVFAYDPKTNRWQKDSDLPKSWPEKYATSGSSGFYHPGLDLHFFHVAGDSQDNGRILVYRYHKK